MLQREHRVYESIDDAMRSRTRRGLPDEYAVRQLVERSLRPCPGGVTWTTDPRLYGASAVKMTDAQIQAVLGALCMPTLLMLAERNSHRMPKAAQYARHRIAALETKMICGSHHFHMESQVDEVAQYLANFLSSLDIQDFA